MPLELQWTRIRLVFNEAFNTSRHDSIATTGPGGITQVTPIGLLPLEPGRAIDFEEFTTCMPAQLQENARVCVRAVNSGRWFWLAALLCGRFRQPPAMRLYGTAGVRCRATSGELAR
jgi:hypothetical protein